MNPAQLLAHFDRIGEAPEAVPRLRRFILDLAVRGKLVEQDPRDEPASELFKRIQTEKTRLFKAGEIRKVKSQPLAEEDEVQFSLPAGWELVRIRQVTSDRGQTIPDKPFTYIDVTAINKEIGRITDAKVLSASNPPSRARKLVRTGDVLYSCVRPYLLNIAVIENDIIPPPIASTAFAVLNGLGLILSKYLWIVLRSPFMVECVEAKMRGQAYPAINDSDFALLPFPLPPLAEQHRIVAKVDELMALCDRLETAQSERESHRGRLVASSLHRLNNGADADAIREHARFYFNHLPRLTARPDHIKQLRQTILNLAVRGKLVPQDPKHRPMSIADIRDEHQTRWKITFNGKSYKQPAIANPAISEEIPSTWCWATIEELADPSQPISYGILKPGSFVDDGIRMLRIMDLKNGVVSKDRVHRVSQALSKQFARTVLAGGEVLVSLVGTIGLCAIVPPEFAGANIHRNLGVIKPGIFLTAPYLLLSMNSDIVDAQVKEATTGGNQPLFNLGDLKKIGIPLSSIEEQHRIVAKVDELMALCDQLETQLTTTQSESRHLLEAILNDALSVNFYPNGINFSAGICNDRP